MTRAITLKHEFVEYIPATIAPGTLYVSIPYATAVHLCACGCGNEIVTPITPRDWQLTFDGETITLYPSIGNWNLPCQSHYWIRRNQVQWAPRWSREQIAAGRTRERMTKERYFDTPTKDAPPTQDGRAKRLLRKIKKRFSR
jgi:Family of unknown function (DUF6527)